MSTNDIDPSLWTFRFKQHKITVLLFVEQTQTFTSIKSDLLEALRKCGHSELNGQPLPTDPEDVILGVPVDRNDIAKGWVGLDIPVMENGDSLEDTKKRRKKDSVLSGSPLGAGLKDGAMLAFKFKGEDAEMDGDGSEADDGNWDVIIPSYEEESLSQA
ncbi:hypothetical protein MMC30_004127 [Trapelia coarctata]|nr:hypothetical protein [Trapelia coarctata]